MAEYTKGPWHTGFMNNKPDSFKYVQMGSSGGFIVKGTILEEAHANANLIEAAPDMLEMLGFILEEYNSVIARWHREEMEKLIDKIKGESK